MITKHGTLNSNKNIFIGVTNGPLRFQDFKRKNILTFNACNCIWASNVRILWVRWRTVLSSVYRCQFHTVKPELPFPPLLLPPHPSLCFFNALSNKPNILLKVTSLLIPTNLIRQLTVCYRYGRPPGAFFFFKLCSWLLKFLSAWLSFSSSTWREIFIVKLLNLNIPWSCCLNKEVHLCIRLTEW